jgi:hypothetical protein
VTYIDKRFSPRNKGLPERECLGCLEIVSGEGDIRDEAAAPTLRPRWRAAMVRRALA